MTTLTEFLLERIAEDEAAARTPDNTWPDEPDMFPDDGIGQHSCDERGPDFVTIGSHRVWAECAAKRAIVAAVTAWMAAHPEEDHVPAGDDVLAWLAAVYRDHPAYQPGWAPADTEDQQHG